MKSDNFFFERINQFWKIGKKKESFFNKQVVNPKNEPEARLNKIIKIFNDKKKKFRNRSKPYDESNDCKSKEHEKQEFNDEEHNVSKKQSMKSKPSTEKPKKIPTQQPHF